MQEALTNTLKHAGAETRAQVRLQFTTTDVVVTVLDDGTKQPPRPQNVRTTHGHGIAGMAERAAAHAGAIETGPRPDGGWYVHARLRYDPPLAERTMNGAR